MSGGGKTPEKASEMTARRERGFSKFMLISLALNIFFVGAAGALAARYYLGEPQWRVKARDHHDPARRIERLAARLAPEDAAILRAEFASRASAAEAARETLRRSREDIRRTLQAEPYDAARARAAMAASRAAHSAFYAVLQDVVVSAAARMSPAGRVRLGEAASRKNPRVRKAN
jgi:uncharacterized membrane protein